MKEPVKDGLNFTDVVLSSQKLASSVAETFFNQGAPEKLNSNQFADAFKQYIFSDQGMEAGEINKTYHTVVRTLRQNYSRTILLDILSTSPQETLDEESLASIVDKKSFARICDIIHIDFMIGAHVSEFYGNP